MNFWGWIAVVLVAFLLVNVVWRYLSRRYQLPCPTLFARTLEGDWSDRLLGTTQTLDWMDPRPGERILEVGPGPGRLLIPASRRILPGGSAVGLDIQSGMLERLRKRAAEQGASNIELQLGDATEPTLPTGEFDLIYLCTVLGEIPDRAAALANCRRMLRPGGRLAITEIIGDPHYQRQSVLMQLAREAGFSLAKLHNAWRSYTAIFEIAQA